MSARLGVPAGDVDAVVELLAETELTVGERLEAAGAFRAAYGRLSAPPDVAELLACAVAAAEDAGDAAHAFGLRLQYLEALPGA
ncbi:MAG: hypothetical protein EP329_06380, partial [Deltaproteobacteria bacterium]